MNDGMFRLVKYAFVMAIVIVITFVLLGVLVFNTFFVVDKGEAVPTGGAGVINPYKFAGDIDVDTGKIYLGYTTTPSLGIHDEHAVIYPKSDTNLYYLYDKAGQVERKLLYEDSNGNNITWPAWATFIPTVTLVGGTGNVVPTYITNNGRYCQIGKIVYVDVLLQGDGGDDGAGTGQINIALPVTAGTNILNSIPVPCGSAYIVYDPDVYPTQETRTLYIQIEVNADTCQLKYLQSLVNIDPLIGEQQDLSTRAIRLHFWYEVD